MTQQTKLQSIKLLSLAIVAVMTIITGAAFSVSAQQPKPVLKDRLVKVLQDKSLSKEQITSIIKKNGVDFEMTAEVEKELRNAGADNTIVEAARNNYRGEALLTDDPTDTTAAKPEPVKKKGIFGKLAEGVGKAANKTKETMSTTPASNEQQASSNESAAKQGSLYKVGDRVEINHYGDYQDIWVKGTIASIYINEKGEQAAFGVRQDDVKDYTGAGQVYTMQARFTRRLNETAAEKQTQAAKQTLADNSVVKLRLDENNKILADRELLDCDNLGLKPFKNGTAPTLQTTGKVIRCHREKKGNAETVTIDINSFQPASPNTPRLIRDVPADADMKTLIYPIKTTFTQKSYTRAVVYTKVIETIYSCYVNKFGDWRCFNGAFKEKGEMKRTPVQP